jgi:hypothetical protein
MQLLVGCVSQKLVAKDKNFCLIHMRSFTKSLYVMIFSMMLVAMSIAKFP